MGWFEQITVELLEFYIASMLYSDWCNNDPVTGCYADGMAVLMSRPKSSWFELIVTLQ